ncbi:MAG: PAS domain S-box protein, partial [Curvibacter sp.]|nr:PAS domain S-box protein [Curvibacter sp.]
MKIDLPFSPPEPGELYRAIVESSDDAIISKSLDGTIMSWNPAACRIFGYSTAEMLGRSIRNLIPAGRIHEEDLILARIRNGETVDHFETQRVRKDGELIHVSVTISPVYDARGIVIGASKIARDISRRVHREQRMRLMDRVFDATSEAIVVTDEQGVILEVNQAFSEITGYAREDVIGQHPRMLRSGRQAPEVHLAMLQTLLRSGHCQGEVWSRRKSGQAYAVMLSVSQVPDPSQGPRRYVALFADITLLREHQEQIEQLAHYDALTRLPNRLLLTDRLGQAIIKAQRQHSLLAIVYLDLDGF